MSHHKHLLATIVSANHIPQALTLYSYANVSNPESHFIIFLVGERAADYELCDGPEWVWWDQLLSDDARVALAREYTPFELVCSIRGKVHHYLATCRQFQKWILIDTDIGIYASLEPIWNVLDSASIAFAAHAEQPVSMVHVPQHEGAFIKSGLFNGGVVAMKKSIVAEQASAWLDSRLRSFGHAYEHRSAVGMAVSYDFEFVDQIWLNLLFLYFRSEVAILDGEVCNLGHWNLHQGNLVIDDGEAFINGKRLQIAHFSGLPSRDKLNQVSIHSQLYIDNPSSAWAALAQDYLDRLDRSQARYPAYSYPYAQIQPKKIVEPNLSSPACVHVSNLNLHSMFKASRLPKYLSKLSRLWSCLKYFLAKIS
jgi:hypothetical protein